MPLPIGTCLPPLNGATEWLDEPIAAERLQGGPTLVQFWAISCPICKTNMPNVLRFLQTYEREGLQLLSVHRPRMESDMDIAQVRATADALALSGPCAIDNAHTLDDLFQTGGVSPCYFLFDAEGRLRSRAAGQLGLKMAENSLKRLLATEPLSL
jgi:thiol-disulfide isomerase/thioredoxin